MTVPFRRFLGYDRGEDGNLVVNPEQAKLVQRIYGMFLIGMSPIRENAHVALDQAEYQQHYDSLVERFDKAKARPHQSKSNAHL